MKQYQFISHGDVRDGGVRGGGVRDADDHGEDQS